jgi:hypothetical protein
VHLLRTRAVTDTELVYPPSSTNDRPPGEYLTRRQSAEYIRNVLGRPMSFSTASKLAAQGEFAEPALWWGKRPLYTRGSLRTWADARSRPTKERPENTRGAGV